MIESLPGDEAPDVVALSLSCEFVARAITDFGAKVRSVTFISPTDFQRAERHQKRLSNGSKKSSALQALAATRSGSCALREVFDISTV